MSESVILIGGGGHAKVIIDCIHSVGDQVAGILDDGLAVGTMIHGIPVLGKAADYEAYKQHRFLVAIGDNSVRRRIVESMDVQWHTAVHRTAVVSSGAQIGAGTVVMPNAVINAGATVGSHCIINTGAIVEHDNCLGDFVHISTAAALGGTVSVGDEARVCIGAHVKNNISICGGCTIGAGAVVIKNITEPGTYVGIPAMKIK